ncbi:MAG: ABC transporter substrate-binding protein [Caldimonas sp.]
MKDRFIKSALGLGLAFAALAAQAQWSATPAVKALYDEARKEGQVVVWGTAAREIDWLPKAFGAVFPGIDVKVMADNNITTKAIAEARAGRHSFDLMSTSLSLTLKLEERKMLEPVDWQMFGVDKSNTAFDGRVAYTHNVVYTIAYNKDKVKPADVPKQWADLLDPRYKGKMVASSFLLPRMVSVLGLAWGEDKTAEFARELVAKADIMQTKAPRESFLQSGERLYSVAEIDSFPKLWARDGIPVSFVIPEPVLMSQFGVLVMHDAPHPAAARLMAGWMASAEGKREREKEAFQTDYLPTSANETARRIYSSGAKVVLDTPQELGNRDKMLTKIAPIVSGQSR